MRKNEWAETIGLILLGIFFDRLIVPYPPLQSFLLSSKWGVPMAIGLIALILAVFLFLYADYGKKRKAKMEQEISKLAYSIWEKNGKQNGHALEDWKEAVKLYREQKRR